MSDTLITQTVANFGYAGSVSHGTMRTWDLLDAFQTPLDELSDNETLKTEVRDMLALGEDEVQYGNKADEAYELLDSVFDALDAVAPDGYIFGAHEGDSSDFGFFRAYEEPNCWD